jgi:hypothetical protein
MATYSIEEALQIMSQRCENGEPVPFAIQFVTCDVKRNTGGERRVVKTAGMYTSHKFRDVQAQKASAKDAGEPGKSMNWRNATRNIECLATHKIHKVHIILIEKINGVPVAL